MSICIIDAPTSWETAFSSAFSPLHTQHLSYDTWQRHAYGYWIRHQHLQRTLGQIQVLHPPHAPVVVAGLLFLAPQPQPQPQPAWRQMEYLESTLRAWQITCAQSLLTFPNHLAKAQSQSFLSLPHLYQIAEKHQLYPPHWEMHYPIGHHAISGNASSLYHDLDQSFTLFPSSNASGVMRIACPDAPPVFCLIIHKQLFWSAPIYTQSSHLREQLENRLLSFICDLGYDLLQICLCPTQGHTTYHLYHATPFPNWETLWAPNMHLICTSIAQYFKNTLASRQPCSFHSARFIPCHLTPSM